MAKIWLPIKEPTSGRETILYIPGASHMDKGKLREILAAEKEKIRAELKAQGPRPKGRFSKAEIALALRDFRRFLDRKEQGTGGGRYF